MNNQLLHINVSEMECETDEEDIIKISLSNEEIVEINFSKLINKSRRIRDKYKYSEAQHSIQIEINDISREKQINDEVIKLFVQLIQDDEVNIPIEYFIDLYTLSSHFDIPKFLRRLDIICQYELCNDLNFTLQILLNSNSTDNRIDPTLTSRIEDFLTVRINECIANQNFRKLPISTIYRIIERSNKEDLDQNSLIEFILESVDTRFILFKFVELSKLTDDKIEEFLNFFDEIQENSNEKYLEYMRFNLFYIKQMRNKFDELFKNFNQTKQELNQTKDNFNQIQQELEQEKNESAKIRQELNQTNQELEQTKQELKQYTQGVMVCGYNKYNILSENSNNINKNGNSYISPTLKSSLDPSSLLSYSVYCRHAVLVKNDGSLLGIGYNNGGRISGSLEKKGINQFTEFSIKDDSGHKLAAISAICCAGSTLYMLSKSSGKGKQLAYCEDDINGGKPVFLNIGDQDPIALFGGKFDAAAVSDKGEVIYINRNSVKNSPHSYIAAISLPDGEKASSVACLHESVIALSTNGRVFSSPIESGKSVLRFSAVEELAGEDIISLSGKHDHCLAVSKEGRAFARGSNGYGQLGLGEGIKSVSTFTKIESLSRYKIKECYAGNIHSLFETQEGRLFACGRNLFGCLFLNIAPGGSVYLPKETVITGSTFCIPGDGLTAAFIGIEPPPNTPNKRVK